MKQKDLITIIGTVIVSGILSLLICNSLIFTGQDRKQKVEVVTPITADFTLPDKAIFNSDAVDPTQLIEIGPNTNNQPFVNK